MRIPFDGSETLVKTGFRRNGFFGTHGLVKRLQSPVNATGGTGLGHFHGG